MLLEELRYLLPGIAKQPLMDELDGRGGALDVQQDGADPGQVDAVVRSGK